MAGAALPGILSPSAPPPPPLLPPLTGIPIPRPPSEWLQHRPRSASASAPPTAQGWRRGCKDGQLRGPVHALLMRETRGRRPSAGICRINASRPPSGSPSLPSSDCNQHSQQPYPTLSYPTYDSGTAASLASRAMRHLRTFRGHRLAVYCLACDARGRYVITGSDDWLVKV